MAILTPPSLFQIVVEAVRESGWDVLYVAQDLRKGPFKLILHKDNQTHRIIFWIWNVTYGGYPRDPNEYRIQLKVTELHQEPGWKTLILGWWDEGRVFVGFDIRKRKEIPGYSSSVQIKVGTLTEAAIRGVSAYVKDNDEIAIAFRSDFFVEYVTNLEQLHDFGETQKDFEVLEQVTEHAEEVDHVDQDLIDQVAPARQEVLVIVSRKLRANSFRRRVLTAYEHHCAFCDIQLKLVEAAHILPVSDSSSTDETSNGIALCVLHHRAYDQSLVRFNEDFLIQPNLSQIESLRLLNLDGGANKFISDLRDTVRIPPSPLDRPRKEYISRANELRGW